MSNRKLRKIVVDGVEYGWRVGRLYVYIRGPNGLKLTPDLLEATCGYYAWRDFEKNNARIEPSMIAKYIRQKVGDAW